MTPALVDDIFVYTSGPRSLYLNPEAPDWITIEEKYKPILDLFDGKNDESAIYNYINRFYHDEKDILVTQIKSLLETSGIFNHNQIQNSRVEDSGVSVPKYIYLTLTDSCNLKCVYCYATERKKRGDAGYETWKKYVSDIIDYSGKPVFTFTGGEPLMVPYIFDLAAYIKERGCECLLLTNGTFIDSEEIAKKITALFDLVKISLDSADEDISKDLRGPGVAEKAASAFKLLLNSGCNVQIMATVTTKTLESINSFSEHFNHHVIFQPFYSMGRARINSDLSITGKQYYDALTKNGKFDLLHGYADNILSFRNNPFKRCTFAKEELSVDSKGNIFPCHMLHYDNLLCGNLNTKSIEDIYKNSTILNKLRAINVDTLPRCKVCVFRNFCGGGCRARNDIPKHGIEAYNEFCEFEQLEILDALLYSYG
ncbi:MAG: radical SAM protein [Treponema sp.]|jgi:radical SAM protein with 4Fe4S-binding SPASM domain|nr:radical SAM protein [Treponema sp.]